MDPFQQSPAFLAAFRAGEPSALDTVYRAFVRPLRTFILRGFAFQSAGRHLHFGGRCPRPELEDVLQETFRRAFGPRARATYDGVRPYKNYLFTIARNALLTELTQRSRTVPVADLGVDAPRTRGRGPESHAAGVAPDAHDGVEHQELRSLVTAVLAANGPVQASVFHLRFVEELSQEATARRLGVKRATVRKAEARLRRALEETLRGTGYLPGSSRSDAAGAVEGCDRARWRTGRGLDARDGRDAA